MPYYLEKFKCGWIVFFRGELRRNVVLVGKLGERLPSRGAEIPPCQVEQMTLKVLSSKTFLLNITY